MPADCPQTFRRLFTNCPGMPHGLSTHAHSTSTSTSTSSSRTPHGRPTGCPQTSPGLSTDRVLGIPMDAPPTFQGHPRDQCLSTDYLRTVNELSRHTPRTPHAPTRGTSTDCPRIVRGHCSRSGNAPLTVRELFKDAPNVPGLSRDCQTTVHGLP